MRTSNQKTRQLSGLSCSKLLVDCCTERPRKATFFSALFKLLASASGGAMLFSWKPKPRSLAGLIFLPALHGRCPVPQSDVLIRSTRRRSQPSDGIWNHTAAAALRARASYAYHSTDGGYQ
ncbi:hypothetical protein ACH5RR_003350 [Cinchona calisaya]|uniref:Uncharacterized protein n=1 Tax=Cinchona calisaya TaxID=153742 RepID=A0ABD3AV63_9GENT